MSATQDESATLHLQASNVCLILSLYNKKCLKTCPRYKRLLVEKTGGKFAHSFQSLKHAETQATSGLCKVSSLNILGRYVSFISFENVMFNCYFWFLEWFKRLLHTLIDLFNQIKSLSRGLKSRQQWTADCRPLAQTGGKMKTEG